MQKVIPDAFAASAAASSAASMMDGHHQLHLDPQQQTGINFTIKSADEAILLIEDESSGSKFKVGIGASQNSVTWLSRIKGAKTNRLGKAIGGSMGEYEIRLDTKNTPQILSPLEDRHFWLDWKLDHAHVAQLQLGRTILRSKGVTGGAAGTDDGGEVGEVILKWPIPVTFAPTRISTLMMPQAHVEIR